MKVKDMLKLLFPNMDDEIDISEKDASNVNDNESEKILDKNVDTNDDKDKKTEEDKEVTEMLKIPTFKDGKFDLNSTDNEELKAVLKMANDWQTEQANNALISKAVEDKVNTLKLHRGITKDAVLTLLDKTNISVKDGKVTGVDEAFENLKTAQAGLFVSTKETTSNPMLEGFNPAKGTSAQTVPNSFTEAFAMIDNV